MQLNNLKAKQEMKTRLRRLEGQLRGVQNMLDEERDCKEIIQQLSSIRSAVQSASTYLLREYTACSMDQIVPDDVAANRRIMNDLISLISKAS